MNVVGKLNKLGNFYCFVFFRFLCYRNAHWIPVFSRNAGGSRSSTEEEELGFFIDSDYPPAAHMGIC